MKVINGADDDWDKRVASTREGNFYQTTIYAKACSELHGTEPIYLRAVDGGETVGFLLAFKDGLGQQVLEENAFLKPLLSLNKKTLARIYWYYGPIALREDGREEIIRILLEAVEEHAKKVKAIRLEALPAHHFNSFDDKVSLAFKDAGFSGKKYGTFLVDLSIGPEMIWKKLKKSARKAVRDCGALKIIVSKAESEKEVQEYLNLLQDFRKKNKLLMPPFYPSLKLWREEHGKTIEIFLARQEGKLVSGMGVIYFNNVVTEVAVARDMECKAYAQDAIKWVILEWASSKGYKTFDLAGVNPNPQTRKEKGGFQFKAKWGGDLTEYMEYSKELSTHRRNAFKVMKRITGRDK